MSEKRVVKSATVYGEWRSIDRYVAVPGCEERTGSYLEVWTDAELAAYYKQPLDRQWASGHELRQIRQFGGWAETVWRGASWQDGHPDRVARISTRIDEANAASA